ncbi:MAG TPA: hypothetical protein VML55_15670, partial [Planctomycetaceae bacterium]|nr:hypothetical protein [Planctomycetaceae bacterium]
MHFELLDDVLPEIGSFSGPELRSILFSAPWASIGPILEYHFLRLHDSRFPAVPGTISDPLWHELFAISARERFDNVEIDTSTLGRSAEFCPSPP